jgi:hypothetical protein
MKRLVIQYSWILGIAAGLLLLLLLTGCGQVPFANKPPVSILESTQQQEHTEHTAVDDHTHSTPNFSGIAHALGCVFAPGSCD